MLAPLPHGSGLRRKQLDEALVGAVLFFCFFATHQLFGLGRLLHDRAFGLALPVGPLLAQLELLAQVVLLCRGNNRDCKFLRDNKGMADTLWWRGLVNA